MPEPLLPHDLETPRMLLKPVDPAVYAAAMKTASVAEVSAYFGYPDEEDARQEMIRFQGGYTTFNKSFLYFRLVLKETGATMGWCGFHTWYFPHFRAELGYMLHNEQYKRQGYMSEALPPIIAYGFGPMKLNRIEAFVAPGNEPSLKLLHNLHFTREGYLKQHYKKGDTIQDSVLFGLVKEDYDKQNGKTI